MRRGRRRRRRRGRMDVWKRGEIEIRFILLFSFAEIIKPPVPPTISSTRLYTINNSKIESRAKMKLVKQPDFLIDFVQRR